jgi:DNA-binding SARP family transcriptional activator
VRIRLLGPIEVVADDGAVLRLPPFQVRLLTRLALAPNQVVSVDRLAEDLWQGEPPPSATAALRTHVSRLRKTLADEERIVTTGPGYLLRLEPLESDAATFAETAGRARRLAAAGDAPGAAETFAAALALWRGPALADVADEPWAVAEAGRLEEERLSAVEERVEAELARGRHAELTGELEALCAAHPIRERLWAARMVALYRSGRQAEALRAFQQLRRYMAQELGIDPSPDLVRLEASVLAQDPSLDLASSSRPAPGPGAPSPSMPSGVVTFLLTDVEGSTEAWEHDAAAMDHALARHDAVIERVVSEGGGVTPPCRCSRAPRSPSPPRWSSSAPCVASGGRCRARCGCAWRCTPERPTSATATTSDPPSTAPPASAHSPPAGRSSSRGPPPSWCATCSPTAAHSSTSAPWCCAGSAVPNASCS